MAKKKHRKRRKLPVGPADTGSVDETPSSPPDPAAPPPAMPGGPAGRAAQAAVAGACVSALLGALWPVSGGRGLVDALLGKAPPGAPWPAALAAAAVLTVAATILLGISPWVKERATRSVGAACAVGALALAWGWPEPGLTSALDAARRNFLGLAAPAWWAIGAGGAVAAAAGSRLGRLFAGGVGVLTLGWLVVPLWVAGHGTLPALLVAGPANGLAGIADAVVMALTSLAAIAAATGRLGSGAWRAVGAGMLLAQPVWSALRGEWAATWLALGLGGIVAVGTAAAASAVEADEPWRTRTTQAGELAATTAVIALWVLLKTHGLRPSDTDENIYFYQAVQMAHGAVPYRDFFFAHPAGHLLVPALLFALFGFSLTGAKLIAPAAALVAGVAVWRTARRAFGATGGLAALVAFLFAAELLKASTNLTGVNLATAGIAAGLWAAASHRWRTAGVAFGIAASMGLYAVFAPAAVVLALAVGHRRAALTVAAWAAGVWLAVQLPFMIAGGDAYFDGVFRYHLHKPVRVEGWRPWTGPGGLGPFAIVHNFFSAFLGGRAFLASLYYHGLLFGVALGAIPLAWAATGGRLLNPRNWWDGSADGTAWLVSWVALLAFVQLAQLREIYDYYFVLALAPTALAFGYAASAVPRWLARGAEALASGRRPAQAAWVALAVACSWLAIPPARAWANARRWPAEARKAGEVRRFAYYEPPVLTSLSGLVRALFWRDHRVRGELQPGYAHYLWSKKRYLSVAAPMADYIRQHSPPEATITGASTVAPLVALLSGHRLAADEADTNSKRFRSGITPPRKFFDKVCATPLLWAVGSARSYFSPRQFRRLGVLKHYFALEREFLDDKARWFGVARYQLWRRRGDPHATPPVCKWEP